MNVVDRIKALLGQSSTQAIGSSSMREILDAGRRAKFDEDYDRALDYFGQAVDMTKAAGEPAAIAVVALHQAEVLIRQRKWTEAEQLLASLQHTARQTNQPVQTAYTLSTLGTLAQEQGDWTTARSYYEQALASAKASRSAGAEGRAMGHLADTYLHEGNASYAAHLLRECLPRLNATGDIELSSYFVGLLGQALIASGQEIEGQHLLGRALQLAQHIHYRYYERHWALLLGERALIEARYHDAYAHFLHALRLFQPGSRTPDYVTALSYMSQVCLSLRDTPQSLSHAQQAVALADALDGQIQAMAQGTMGTALRAAGRSAEAIPYLERAAQGYAALENQATDRVEIETLRSLGAAQMDADSPDAEATYQRAVQKAQLLDTPLDLAQCRRDLGLLYARKGRMADAVQEWSAALTVYETQRHYAQVARLYCDIANARKSLGQGQRAMKDYEHALMTLNSVDSDDLETRGLVLSNAANAFVEQGDIDSADAFFSEAITIAEKIGDSTAEATRRGNYGWFLLTVGRPRRAIAALEHAVRMSQERALPLQTAVQTSNLGLGHADMGDYAAALVQQRRAFDLSQSLNEPHWQAMIGINLATTLLSIGERDEARTHLERALAYARASSDTDVIIRALTGLARAAIQSGMPDTATPMLDEAISLARRANLRRLLADALAAQSEADAALDHHAQAAARWDEATRLYGMLRMPQAKVQPAWLGDRALKP